MQFFLCPSPRNAMIDAIFVSALIAIQISAAHAEITCSNLTTLQAPPGTIQYGLATDIDTMGIESAAAGQVVGEAFEPTYFQHAIVWNPSSGSSVDLNPAGFNTSIAYSTDGTQQVGIGTISTPLPIHALLWSGSASSVVDLTPNGYYSCYAYGNSQTEQVGYGLTNSENHALLWRGTAASVVDLSPAGYGDSMAYATNGNQQVGTAFLPFANYHAMLWNGTSASAVDLNPAGFPISYAYGTNGTQQVGCASETSNPGAEMAILWNGSASSAVDLNPAGFTFSIALGTNGEYQVGYGATASGVNHALLWEGSAMSDVDLQSLLPETFISSEVTSIVGNTIFGVASDSKNLYAVEWTISVPEPAPACLIAIAALGLMFRRRSSHCNGPFAFNIAEGAPFPFHELGYKS